MTKIKNTNMTQGSPLRHILFFALPLFIGNMFQQLYNTVDTLIIRQTISTEAFSAVGASSSLLILVLGFIIGTTAGLSVVTAQFYGANDIENVKRSIATSMIIATAITIIVTVLSVIFCRPLLIAMQTPLDIIDRSYSYLIVIFGGIFANMLYNFYSSMMRALGNSKIPLYFLILASGLNIILDFVLIVYGKLDVAGAAYATVISQFISGVGLLIYSKTHTQAFALSKAHFTLNARFIKKHLKSALPMGFQFSIIAVGIIIVQASLNGFGTDYITSYVAATKIEQILSQVYPALGTAVVTYVAQNFGAGKIDRIKVGVHRAMLISTIYTAIASCIFIFEGQFLLEIILGTGESPEIYQNAQIYLNFCAIAFLFLGIIYVYRNALQGISRGHVTFTAGILELATRIAVVLLLTDILGFSGICIASPLTWFTTGVFVFGAYIFVARDLNFICN